MRSKIALLIALLALGGFAAGAAQAAEVVNQGAGSKAVSPWRVTLTGAGGGNETAAAAIPYAAGVPTNVSVSTTTAAATGLTAERAYRIVCSVDTYYRVGSGTPTALTTDNDLPARVIEYVKLPAATTAIAFITASGSGTCKVGLIAVD